MEPVTLEDVPPFWRRTDHPDGTWTWDAYPHPGQSEALQCQASTIAVIAGGQSGKTLIGPAWLLDEMQRRGPGDYLIGAMDFPTLKKQAVPEFQSLFESVLKLGKLKLSPLEFTFSKGGLEWMGWADERRPPRVVFGHTTKPSTMEAFTLKGAWIDEAGMPGFRLSAYEDLQQRLAVSQGRLLLTTKPYAVNWLKTKVYDEWERGNPDFHVVQFGSAMNPAMPAAEIEKARRTLPGWKFRMHWLGQFDRPAGRIYDCWDAARHVVPDYPIPHTWKRYGGLDFGGVNTAGVVAVQHPATGEYVIVREYHQGSLTSAGHARALEKLAECGIRPELGEIPPRCQWWTGGAGSEDQWRREFAQAGMPVAAPPVKEVDVGIARVYSMLATGRLRVFRSCEHTIDQLSSYSYVVGDDGEVKEPKEIEAKASFHLCLAAGTMVETARGQVPIECVGIGDLAMTRHGFRPVVATMQSGRQPVSRVTMEDGSEVTGTGNHPVWVEGKGFVDIDALRYGDVLWKRSHAGAQPWRKESDLDVRRLSSTASSGIGIPTRSGARIASTTRAARGYCIATSGSCTMAPSRQGWLSTTRTKTPATTPLATWNSWDAASIAACTTRAGVRLPSGLAWNASGLLLPPGTAPRLAGSGTGSTPRAMGSGGKSRNAHAITAARSMFAGSLASRAGSARSTAALAIGGPWALMTLPASARSAREHSSATSTCPPGFARVRVSSITDGGLADVFNLEVDGPHEYCANGILVSNCDAARYLACRLEGEARKPKGLPGVIERGRR